MTYNIINNKKHLVINVILFIIFLYLYTLIDLLPIKSYEKLNLLLVIINITLNIIMAFIASYTFTLVYIHYKKTNYESNASYFAPISLIFGMFTYGCSSCAINLLASIGISYSLVALPFNNLPYKFLSFIVLIIGYVIVKRNIKTNKCKIK